jgi:hypothetical protein
MVYRPKVDPKLCFVALPLMKPFTDYFSAVIEPAARDSGLTAKTSAQIYEAGSIIRSIWDKIWAASVVIADVTGRNPNVNYELGICHALGVPTIILSQSIDDVPFDYRQLRCILYQTNDVDWQSQLRNAIRETIMETLKGERESEKYSHLPWPYATNFEGRIAAKVTTMSLDHAITACTIGKDRIDQLRIFAFNAGSIFSSIEQSRVAIGTCYIVLPRFEQASSEAWKSKVNSEVEFFAGKWKGLQQKGRIKDLDIRYNEHLPSHYCCIFDRYALLLGTYTYRDLNPATWNSSYSDPLVIANADDDPTQKMVIELTEWFDGVP